MHLIDPALTIYQNNKARAHTTFRGLAALLMMSVLPMTANATVGEQDGFPKGDGGVAAPPPTGPPTSSSDATGGFALLGVLVSINNEINDLILDVNADFARAGDEVLNSHLTLDLPWGFEREVYIDIDVHCENWEQAAAATS